MPVHPTCNVARRRLLVAMAAAGSAALLPPAWASAAPTLPATPLAGDDFYTAINHRWLAETTAPSGYTQFSELNAMHLRVEARIAAIVKDAAGDAGGPLRVLHDDYRDVARIEALDLTPFADDLAHIARLPDHDAVARWMARPASSAIAGAYVLLDAKDTRRCRLHIDQQTLGGRRTGLPNRAYYERTDGDFPGFRDAYVDHVTKTLADARLQAPERRARAVLALEARLASVEWPAEWLRDRRRNYHLLTPEALADYAPGFPWTAWLDALDVTPPDAIVLNTDTAVRDCAAIFAETPVDDWRSYLAFHWLRNQVDLLPARFRDRAFAFYGRTLGRQQVARARDAKAVQFVNAQVPDLVGRAYVARHFTGVHRARALAMARHLRDAFDARLARADWLDEDTRAMLRRKLANMQLRLGFPDDLRDYAEVRIVRGDLVGNVRRLQQAQWARDRGFLDVRDPVWPWHLPPQTVDGSYSPQLNAVTFPAGLLQPPASDLDADMARNFGAIGSVLGHEIAHAFDDQGSLFDERGNLGDGWPAATRAAFVDRTHVLVAQYGAIEVLPGVRLDGTRSLGENLADLIGVATAHDAWTRFAREAGQDPAAGDRPFFEAWATLWRSLETDGSLRHQATSAYHSPPRFRVNGVVRNLDAWYAAYDVKPGDALYLSPDARARIW